ncbi:hypothetical protein [Niabella ginsengisoli]|uniref:Uncharacterized protein n=1 Tax=Niabella ginsengisoli TaxID=522298 RepID=A0ABS9SR25_9BACT|nr:hypothetical protein [Niabella ginsengisoli]MCH5600817.1 hypothetical protein [Niabella ginsengisoli]
MILIVTAALWGNQLIAMYTGNSSEQASLASEVGQLIVGTVITLTIIQLLYPLNLIIGLFKNKKS